MPKIKVKSLAGSTSAPIADIETKTDAAAPTTTLKMDSDVTELNTNTVVAENPKVEEIKVD
mgnify:CR=1 FL=1